MSHSACCFELYYIRGYLQDMMLSEYTATAFLFFGIPVFNLVCLIYLQITQKIKNYSLWSHS